MGSFARRSVVLALLLTAAGCSSASMAPAKGRVLFRGRPVGDAAVTFNPVPRADGDREAGKPATGFSAADGTFALSTFRPYDGALVGPHRVTVALDETNPVKCKRTKRLELEVKPGDNAFDIEMDP